MSAIKALLEQQLIVMGGIAKATGMPFIGNEEFTEEEMEMGRYDHARSDERDMEDGE